VSRYAVAGVPLVLIPALGAVQGGFQPDTWVWAGTLAAWAAAVGLVTTSRPGALRTAWRWPAAAVALLLWTLASALWSAEQQQSLLEARRMIVYAAVALALVVLAREGTSWTLVRATHLAVSGLLVYALLRYLVGPRVDDRFEGYLLSQPLGYANAVGILAAMGILLALGLVVEGRPPAVRAFGAATVPPLALALLVSGSNASWLSLAVGLAAVAVLAARPQRVLVISALLAVPSATLVGLGRYSRYADTASPRVGGSILVVAAAAAATAAALVVLVAVDESSPVQRRWRVSLAGATLAGAIVAVAVAGGTTQPRRTYFHVAWHEYLAHPVLGSGAGTFGRYWLLSGQPAVWGGALDAHSLYLETLAELGPLGLLLLVVFLLYPLRQALASRHARGVPAAAGAAIAFLVHAGVDWDWELPAVVVAGLCCLAAVLLAGEGRAAVGRTGRALALAAAVALGLCAVAGTASSAVPSASQNDEAPPSGASSSVT
jgi:hypothetical protein